MRDGWIQDGPGVAPPQGYICIQTPDGQAFWADPGTIRANRTRRSELTEEQVTRIRAYKAILAEHDPSPVEEAIADFQADEHPEDEIAIWERIARTYQAELRDRPGASPADRRLLYKALLWLSTAGSLDGLVSSVPEAKRLGQLQRIGQRFFESE